MLRHVSALNICHLQGKLVNTEGTRELIEKGNKAISEVEVEELTTEDVKKTIRNLKNNRAVGTDGIHLELIK